MIDLHLHTAASDGTCTPQELVDRAWRAGIRLMSVTDHDTTAGQDEAARAAARLGAAYLVGIELTTVHAGRDIHVLGYGVAADAPGLTEFVEAQRGARVERAREMARRLERLGVPLDLGPLLSPSVRAGKALGRPDLARALVRAGHVVDIKEAFERFLGDGRPAYVPHVGRQPAQAIEAIAQDGGSASLAHPGLLQCDGLIPPLVDAGLTALEAYHSEHSASTCARYVDLARALGLAVTGGSDFHGPSMPRAAYLGLVALPAVEFEAFRAHAARKGARWAQAFGV